MKPIYFAPLITLIGAISAVINFYVSVKPMRLLGIANYMGWC